MFIAMSNYENAPATQLVATHCCVCARPLVDAVSVEVGMGPDCRKKYYKAPSPEVEARRPIANKIVHALAVGEGDVVAQLMELRMLGFDALVTRLAERLAKVSIEEGGAELEVVFPYNPEAIDAIKRFPRRRASKESGVWTWSIPASDRPLLWAFLKRFFHGQLAEGPKGFFRIG